MATPVPAVPPSEEEKGKRIPGFEAAYAIMVLFILFMLLRRKRIWKQKNWPFWLVD